MFKQSDIMQGPFQGTIASLRQFECPDWFRDAKFGIWSHWGPQSVPRFGDWYARNMYIEGSDQYRYHCRMYGHPSQFGYKDIINLWKAERFDPDGLMALYAKTGAKYFVAQAMHHDNFDNWASKYNPWNAVEKGPKRNIAMDWKQAAVKHGLPFGVTEHLAASYTWWAVSHGADQAGPFAGVPYDGADIAHQSLYRDNDSESYAHGGGWYTKNPRYHQDWFNRIHDLIDQLQPDLLYSDGELPFSAWGLSMVAHLYNTSIALHGQNKALYTFKQHGALDATPGITEIGLLDVERGILDTVPEKPWQDDTSLGDWFYNVKDRYKTASELVDTLVDVVSKNGNLLLNVCQLPDGTLDAETTWTLTRFGAWMQDNAQGLYGTRPYRVASEGKAQLKAGPFQEGGTVFTDSDYRFTQKGDSVYAFRMRSSAGIARIIALGRVYEREVISVTIGDRPVPFDQKDGCLLVTCPENAHHGLPVCIRIVLAP